MPAVRLFSSISTIHIGDGGTLRLVDAGTKLGNDSANPVAMTMDAGSTFAFNNGNGGDTTHANVIINAAGSQATIAGSLNGGGSNLAGTITGVGTLRLTDDGHWNAYTVSAGISDLSATEKLAVYVAKNSGGAKVTLSGTNTYTGGTTVDNAELTLDYNGGASGLLGDLLVKNNSILYTKGDSFGYDNALKEAGKQFGTLTLKDSTWNAGGNNNTMSGVTLVMENSTVNINATSEGGGFDLFNGTNTIATTADATKTSVFASANNKKLSLRAGNTDEAAAGSQAIFDIKRGNFTLDATNTSDLKLDVVVTTKNSGALMPFDKRGSGVLEMTKANDYRSDTLIKDGTILLSGSGTLGSGKVIMGDTENATQGALVLNQNTATTLANAISGNGSVTMKGSAEVTLSGANTYTGTTTIEAGTLSVAGTGALGSGEVTVRGGALKLAQGAAVTSTMVAQKLAAAQPAAEGEPPAYSDVASISGIGTGNASYSNVKVEATGLSRVDTNAAATISNASIMVMDEFILNGITLTNTSVNVLAGGSLAGSTDTVLTGTGNTLTSALNQVPFANETILFHGVDYFDFATTQLSGITLAADGKLTVDWSKEAYDALIGSVLPYVENYYVALTLTGLKVEQPVTINGEYNTVDLFQNIELGSLLGSTGELAGFEVPQSGDSTVLLIHFSQSNAIPEPATATLSLLALAGLAARRRRK